MQEIKQGLPRLFSRTVIAFLPCSVMWMSTHHEADLTKTWGIFQICFLGSNCALFWGVMPCLLVTFHTKIGNAPVAMSVSMPASACPPNYVIIVHLMTFLCWSFPGQWAKVVRQASILDFELSLCDEYHSLSLGWFSGVWILCADVSVHCSIFIDGVSSLHHLRRCSET